MQELSKNQIYNTQASQTAKNAIGVWIFIGLTWFIFDSKLHLFSLKGALFFILGIFAASILSAPLFILKNKLSLEIIENNKNHLMKWLPIIKFFELIQIIITPIVTLIIIR